MQYFQPGFGFPGHFLTTFLSFAHFWKSCERLLDHCTMSIIWMYGCFPMFYYTMYVLNASSSSAFSTYNYIVVQNVFPHFECIFVWYDNVELFLILSKVLVQSQVELSHIHKLCTNVSMHIFRGNKKFAATLNKTNESWWWSMEVVSEEWRILYL